MRLVVLQKHRAFVNHTETGDLCILAVRHQCIKVLGAALVFQYFPAIDPMFDPAIRKSNYPAAVPLPDRNFLPAILFRGYQVIQRCQCAVADHAGFCIRVFIVIKHLVFHTDGAVGGLFFFDHKIFDAGISRIA
jgi:hypothetical protein